MLVVKCFEVPTDRVKKPMNSDEFAIDDELDQKGLKIKSEIGEYHWNSCLINRLFTYSEARHDNWSCYVKQNRQV
jgi:hypothetical protein